MAELEIVDEHVHEHERKRKAAHKKDHNELSSRPFHLNSTLRRRAMVSSIFSDVKKCCWMKRGAYFKLPGSHNVFHKRSGSGGQLS